MIKEYTVKDILNAVDGIQKTKKNMDKLSENRKDSVKKNDVLAANKQAKPSKSDILVLDQMIE